MARIVAISNQKGGVGKSALTSSLGSILTSQGYKVLLINLDPQRNLDMVAGKGVVIKRNDTTSLSVLNVLKGDCSIEQAIISTQLGDLLRASCNLSQWTGRHLITPEEFDGKSKDEVFDLIQNRISSGWGGRDVEVLSDELKLIQDRYDYILMDTNPSLQLLTLAALYASDYVVVPAFTEASSRDAITELWDTIQALNYYHPEQHLRVAGILITKWVKRSINAKRFLPVFEKLAVKMDTILFEQKIRNCISVSEYMASSEDLIRYDPKGNATLDYLAFAEEFKSRIDYLEALKNG